jgi:hypothetical protein
MFVAGLATPNSTKNWAWRVGKMRIVFFFTNSTFGLQYFLQGSGLRNNFPDSDRYIVLKLDTILKEQLCENVGPWLFS